VALTLVPRDAPEAPAVAATEQWLDAWHGAVASTWDYMIRVSSLYDARQLRTWWLADLNQLTAAYLRSPAFIAWMKITLK
jgi:hypothetical protein